MAKLVSKTYGEALFDLAMEEGTLDATAKEAEVVLNVIADNPEVKIILQDIYRDLGITSKAKATDLGKYFKLTRTKITLPDKKTKEGYLLKNL